MKTRYERRRDQRSRLWRKHHAHKKRIQAARNRHINEQTKDDKFNVMPDERTLSLIARCMLSLRKLGR